MKPISAPDRLDELVARLPAEIAPPPRVWIGIEASLRGRDGALDQLVGRLPLGLEPPADLWPGIAVVAGDPRAPSGARAWPRAAGIGVFALALMLALSALRINELGRELSSNAAYTEAPAGSDVWWLARLDALEGVGAPLTAALLRASLDNIRDNYELAKRQRLAIEAAMQDRLDDPNLRALWVHAYETELGLADRAERMLNDQRRGYGI